MKTDPYDDWHSGALLWGCIGWIAIAIFLAGMVTGALILAVCGW